MINNIKKSIHSATHRLTDIYKRANRNVVSMLLMKAVGGILLALLIAFFTDLISQSTLARLKAEEEQAVVGSLCIGTNKEYVDSVLGAPYLKNTNEITYMEDCFYKVDGAIVRLFFEKDSAKGIFITITDEDAIGKYAFHNYLHLSNNKKLGSFTFEDIKYRNEGNYSTSVNGIGFQFYIEQNYFTSDGNYYHHFYAILPYGVRTAPVQKVLNQKEHYDEYGHYYGGYFPNTVGIADQRYSEKVCAMILDYERFDYASINNFLSEALGENYILEYYGEDENADYPNYFKEDLERYFEEEYYQEDYN